jgi:hypothetical protein
MATSDPFLFIKAQNNTQFEIFQMLAAVNNIDSADLKKACRISDCHHTGKKCPVSTQ